MKGTEINKWFNVAARVKKDKNYVAAKLWIMANVPSPFRMMLMEKVKDV